MYFRFLISDYRSDTCIIDFLIFFKNVISADFCGQIHVIQNSMYLDRRLCCTGRHHPWISGNKVWHAQKWGSKPTLYNQSQIHPRWIISIPNHFATLLGCSESQFDNIQAFKANFSKSNCWSAAAMFSCRAQSKVTHTFSWASEYSRGILNMRFLGPILQPEQVHT